MWTALGGEVERTPCRTVQTGRLIAGVVHTAARAPATVAVPVELLWCCSVCVLEP